MSVNQKVTRLEIAEAVGEAFQEGGLGRGEILALVEVASRPEVVDVLRELPDRRYSRLNELWEELHDIPVGV